MAKQVENKCFYGNMFPSIQQPSIALSRVNGIWFDSGRNIVTKAFVAQVIAAEGNLFVKKATDSYGRFGVLYIGNDVALDKFWKFVDATASDILVQHGVKQHALLSSFNSSSINTIRVLSLLSSEGVKIYSSVLRIGASGSKVDNEASGGYTCGILPNRRLRPIGHNKKGKCFTEHPTSHIKFDGYQIPNYEKVLALIPKLHTQAPHFRLISWDIAISEDGTPTLIEANLSNGGISIHQLNNGPLFGDDIKKILDEVFYHKK